MRPLVQKHLNGELVISDGRESLRCGIAEAVRLGELRKLLPTIYTSSIDDGDDNIIRRNLYVILGVLYPNAVISHRSAIEAGPRDGHIVLTYKYTKKVRLPGITVHLMKGKGPLEFDIPFIGGLYLASSERSWLENLQNTKAHEFRKILTKSSFLEYLNSYKNSFGLDDVLERLKKAEALSEEMSLQEEFHKLKSILSDFFSDKNISSIHAV